MQNEHVYDASAKAHERYLPRDAKFSRLSPRRNNPHNNLFSNSVLTNKVASLSPRRTSNNQNSALLKAGVNIISRDNSRADLHSANTSQRAIDKDSIYSSQEKELKPDFDTLMQDYKKLLPEMYLDSGNDSGNESNDEGSETEGYDELKKPMLLNLPEQDNGNNLSSASTSGRSAGAYSSASIAKIRVGRGKPVLNYSPTIDQVEEYAKEMHYAQISYNEALTKAKRIDLNIAKTISKCDQVTEKAKKLTESSLSIDAQMKKMS